MNDQKGELDIFWENMLSRDPARVREAWGTLTAEERLVIHAHLVRMSTEEGWAEPQRISAQAALDALRAFLDDDTDS